MSSYVLARSLIRKFIPIGLVFISLVVSIILGEILVRFAVNPGDFLIASLINDPALGQRIKPFTTGHDALGFRNEKVPERVDGVAIGDSMTYGVSAPRDGSWPYQLGEILHEPLYNMALGGYGPLQYLYLAEHEAVNLRPRRIIVGFYFGNDLIDAYSTAHQNPYWHNWLEAGTENNGESEYQRSGDAEPKKPFADLRNWLARHSVLYSMLRITLFPRLAAWEQDRMALAASPDRQVIWVDPAGHSVRTIFTSQLRLSALDMQLPSVQEGLRITKRAFSAIKSVTDAQGAQLMVVLIPTKERAYYAYLTDSGERMPDTYVRLCEAENKVKKDLVQFLVTKGIAYVDVTRALEEKTFQHIQIYPADSDAHPQSTGYNTIAHAVYEALRPHQK